MSLHVCPGESFIFDSRLANYFGKKLSFDFLLLVFDCNAVALRPSFPLVSWTEGAMYLHRFLIIAFLSICNIKCA